MSKIIINKNLAVSILPLISVASNATDKTGDVVQLDDFAITATKDSRPTQEISQSVGVINQETIDDWNVLNIQDV